MASNPTTCGPGGSGSTTEKEIGHERPRLTVLQTKAKLEYSARKRRKSTISSQIDFEVASK
ncbi:uncharacterized protein N7500_003642 [Penicillium coprophilum]|uniref:uncharacterized protein n=1 Tax=Penicillium coprophilum TaxID=36646 RepID=UPI002383ACA8|nr:uncharacterized protein N7500_003642 [Penicillium coprophilum]KAJ5170859.1 hypothetical protein N7500_003642 [Penicillium coprophilum]